MPLDLSSEPFAASGGLAGDGARKLMGAPTLTILQTVLRESGQNSWDARWTGSLAIRIGITLRTLTDSQTRFLREEILRDLPACEVSRAQLLPLLEGPPPTVLEIADFGTFGLSGSTRADLSEDGDEPANFVNFVRNIGARRDLAQGGGTYGYGKMSLFAASRCWAILVDSVTQRGDRFTRRLIGSHVGSEFVGPEQQRFTGRHWWGRRPSEDDVPQGAAWYVEPAIDDDATALSTGLGLPPRSIDEAGRGTTVQILLPDVDPLRAMTEIRDTLLWFFWPKMIVPGNDEPPPITFELRHEDEVISLPDPERFPPLDLYVQAYRSAKGTAEGGLVVRSVAPGRQTGRIGISRGFRNDRMAHPEGVVPGLSHHVAIMRPVELVVRYIEGPPLPAEGVEWGGVFICDGDPQIEAAFAASEPPAHDEWNPNSLADDFQRRIVRQTLTAIGRIANQYVYPSSRPAAGGAEQPPLAAVAIRLGRLLPPDPELRDMGPGSGLSGSRRSWRIDAPTFVRLERQTHGVDAVFGVSAINNSPEPLVIRGRPGLVMDDRVSTETILPDGGELAVVQWTNAATGDETAGDQVALAPGAAAEFLVRIHVPGSAAVGLSLLAED